MAFQHPRHLDMQALVLEQQDRPARTVLKPHPFDAHVDAAQLVAELRHHHGLRLQKVDHTAVATDAAPRLCLAAAPDELPLGPLGLPLALPHLTDATCPIAPVPGASPGPLLVLYTSGTTGAPKGAVLSAAAVARNLDALAEVWQWRPGATVLHALPLFHVHGLVLGWFGSLRVGGRLHWQPRFDPAELARHLPGAILFAVPTMFHRLVEAAAHDPTIAPALRAAKLLISGSAALGPREQQRIHALAGRGVYERYGLTETLINCAVPVSSPPQPGRVGPPLPGVELMLCDDQRRPLPAHDDQTLGEIAVRGPHLFDHYLHNPAATAAVRDADGWFYTGDLATRDAAGSLRIVGRRATDLIKSGGFKIGAGEIEACLAAVPGPLLYARVDGIEQGGTFSLMELELIDPVLFLAHAADAPQRLAEAIAGRVHA